MPRRGNQFENQIQKVCGFPAADIVLLSFFKVAIAVSTSIILTSWNLNMFMVIVADGYIKKFFQMKNNTNYI